MSGATCGTKTVDAIFDVPTSSLALPISALTREKNKININSGDGSSDISGAACSPNTVHWTNARNDKPKTRPRNPTRNPGAFFVQSFNCLRT
jgi:hypothetical protein